MARAQTGDGAAYATLLRECLPLLRRVCAARLHDAAEIDDAVQDTLMAVHLMRHTYDPTRPFRPWIATIAERRAIDRGRRSARRGRNESRYSLEIDLPASPSEPDLLAAGRLRMALNGLPRSQRVALVLTKLQDLTLADASARSGMSVGALKVAVHRAMTTLRRRLDGDG